METAYQILKEPKYELLKIIDSSHNFPLHMHKRICIGVVDSGEKYINLNGQITKFEKNDIFIIPPFTVHSCHTENKVSYTVLCLENDSETSEEIIKKLSKSLDGKIKNIIKCIDKYSNKTTNENNIIQYIIGFIENNYHKSFTIEDIANRLGYSQYYILHLFKEIFGLSLHQYIIQFRIKKAKEYTKEQKLIEIAINNGFYDQSHFIRHFKKHEGITPKNYYDSIVRTDFSVA
jgi:AraC-like DNA-binding protein/mannose-6-phosphate isomerase-like protein (cupin superfamily)